MKKFLTEVAEDILKKHESNLVDLTVVFPGRRAGIFFLKELEKLTEKTIWLPKIYSIDDFILDYSNSIKAEPIVLIYKLYKVFVEKFKYTESFERFWFWGEMLLKDFDEIDKFKIDANDLFSNLKDLKKIDSLFDYLTDEQKAVIKEFWQCFEIEDSSEHKKDFIGIWEVLSQLYFDFKNELKKDNLAYSGMIQLELVERLNKGENIFVNIESISFVGFNALSICEKEIMSSFSNATFYWDYDDYYMSDKHQEAGAFLRENINTLDFKPKREFPNNFRLIPKEIEIIDCAQNITQTKILSKFLSEFESDNNHLDTAIILPDEDMLVPVLHSIPSEYKDINVTMSYPLKNTSIFSLFKHLTKLYSDNSNGVYYYENILNIIQHPLIYNYNPLSALKIINSINKTNRIYINYKDLNSENDLYKLIFSIEKDLYKIIQNYKDILKIIWEFQNSTPESEFVYSMHKTLNHLAEILDDYSIKLSKDSFFKLMEYAFKSSRVNFSGEPLNGIQLMGFLETRCLDFKNIFILNMNEQIFPSSHSSNSFIPANIRKGFGLPSVDYHDNIYAYYFYRLIQRSENIKFIYCSTSDNKSTGEMSRFLYQLKFESGLNFKEYHIGLKLGKNDSKKIIVKKTPIIYSKLKEYLESETNKAKGLYPTAIICYLECQLKFYLKYIAGIKEPNQANDLIDASAFGNILHQTLEFIYNEFKEIKKSSIVESNDKNLLMTLIEPNLKKSIIEFLGLKIEDNFDLKGGLLINYSVIKKLIEIVINYDIKSAPFEIIQLEDDAKEGVTECMYQISTPEGIFNLKLKAKIDRVDIKDGIYRIIDYKTGKTDLKVADKNTLFNTEEKLGNKAVLQVLLYSLIYKSSKNIKFPIKPHLYAIKEMNNSNYDSSIFINKKEILDINDEFNWLNEDLQKVFYEMFDSETEFNQTENSKKCNFCEFKSICKR